MLKINDLLPLNLQEEKIKFFASGYTHNPQFIYQKEIDPSELTQYGKPKWWLLWRARWIVYKNIKQHNIDASTEIDRSAELLLNQSQIEEILEQRLKHYQLDSQYQIQFSNNFLSRISVNLKKQLIKIRLPVQISQNEIESVMAHEIDTHILRQHNSQQQIWHGKKKQYGLKNHLVTEEGLAVVNEMVVSQEDLAYKSAINYVAVDLAMRTDFKTTFAFFIKLWKDPERAWIWTVKKKRGVTDTKQQGAFTKDLVYFEGFIKVLEYLKKNHADPRDLYVGKIDLDNLKKINKIGINQPLLLPLVFTRNQKFYKQKIKQLIKNHFLF